MTDPNGYPILTNNHPATHNAWSGNHFRYRGDDSSGTHRVYARVSNSLASTDAFPTSTGVGHDIKVNISTNVWSDAGTDWPGTVTDGTNVTLYEGSTFLFQFAKPTTWPSSGPTVTSHTPGIVITNDTVTSSDFTWLKDGSAYSPTNMTLIASNTIGANNDTGYIYDFNKNGTGLYTTTIDSKAVTALYFDASWTIGTSASSSRSTNSTRILNVLATIPSNITIGSGSDLNGNPNPLTTVFSYNSRVIQHTMSATINGVTGNIYINFVINNKVINGVSEIVATFYETRTIGTDSSHQSNSVDYIIGAQQTMTYTQSLLGDTTTYYVSDWIYSEQPEGDGYVSPVTTTSNGGGKPDRYPLIMTNLFNRNRSLYSIGMTHKDTWDLFL